MFKQCIQMSLAMLISAAVLNGCGGSETAVTQETSAAATQAESAADSSPSIETQQAEAASTGAAEEQGPIWLEMEASYSMEADEITFVVHNDTGKPVQYSTAVELYADLDTLQKANEAKDAARTSAQEQTDAHKDLYSDVYSAENSLSLQESIEQANGWEAVVCEGGYCGFPDTLEGETADVSIPLKDYYVIEEPGVYYLEMSVSQDGSNFYRIYAPFKLT